MVVNRASFLLALAGLSAGSVAAGYYVAEHGLLKNSALLGATEQQGPAATVEPLPVTRPVAPPAPLCDDMVGSPAACPAPGYPSEEGEGCGALPAKRCDDFKKAMKPRVAEHAVACVNALTAGQRCEATRLNLCGHLALMNACLEADASAGASATAIDDVEAHCQSVMLACAGSPFAPSNRDCRATVSGLSALGRDQMVSCMKAHCADKGLLGCEAVPDSK
jgi:hypothetical protein